MKKCVDLRGELTIAGEGIDVWREDRGVGRGPWDLYKISFFAKNCLAKWQ